MNTNVLTSILKCSNELIMSESFCAKYRIGKSFTRSRKLSFQNLIFFILQSTHKSLSINYSEFIDRLHSSVPPLITKQAVSKARQGISYEAFLELFHLSAETFYARSKNRPTWNGFHIYAIDGSTIQIPESKENYHVFGGNPNKTGIVSPPASASVLYDVLNDIVVDVSLNPYRYNERVSAKEHVHFLPDFQNSVIIFDRGYPSEDMFRFLNSLGILFLMRIPKTFKKAMVQENDSVSDFPVSGNKERLTLRGLRFSLPDGTTEYPVSDIMPHQPDTLKFPELYHLRWGIESKYREFKNRFEMESFNSVKPVSIRQEFFAVMYFSNITAIAKKEADSKIIPNRNNRHCYQANRSYILNRIKCNITFLLSASVSLCNKKIVQIINEASKVLSIIRPDRKFGRFRKNNRRRYHNHMKSCI